MNFYTSDIGNVEVSPNKHVLLYTGDIEDLYKMKLDLNHWAAFSKDCTGPAKRLTRMEVTT